jgi:hypothetical protein
VTKILSLKGERWEVPFCREEDSVFKQFVVLEKCTFISMFRSSLKS